MADEQPVPSFPMFDRRTRATTFVRFTLPVAAIITLVASIFLVFPRRSLEFGGLLVTYLVPPAGKETVIPAAVSVGFEPFLVATYIAGLDMTVGWFLAWNWDVVTRVPLAGPLIERLMASGEAWMEAHPFADRSAFFGLVLFVFFPVQGSGAVAGITLGRLIGMPPQRAWVAIMIGALTASFLWAYGAGGIRHAILTFGFATVLQATVVILAALVFTLMSLRRILT